MTDSQRSIQTLLVASTGKHDEPRRSASELAQFRALYDQHLPYLWKTLRRLGVWQRDLEDVAHDVLLRVYRNMHQYDHGRPLRPWLFGFAFRVASDYRRRASHQRELVGVDAVERIAPDVAPDDQLAHKQTREMVLQALETIKLERRAVFLLHDIDGFAVPEIAHSMAIPINTAYSRLRVARGEFAVAMKRIRLCRGAA